MLELIASHSAIGNFIVSAIKLELIASNFVIGNLMHAEALIFSTTFICIRIVGIAQKHESKQFSLNYQGQLGTLIALIKFGFIYALFEFKFHSTFKVPLFKCMGFSFISQFSHTCLIVFSQSLVTHAGSSCSGVHISLHPSFLKSVLKLFLTPDRLIVEGTSIFI